MSINGDPAIIRRCVSNNACKHVGGTEYTLHALQVLQYRPRNCIGVVFFLARVIVGVAVESVCANPRVAFSKLVGQAATVYSGIERASYVESNQ